MSSVGATPPINGRRLEGAKFHKSDGIWRAGEPDGLRKRAGLQGPIDDAFQQPFLCVRPASGSTLVLEKFRRDFYRYLHGDIRIKSPEEVIDSDIANYNLILFGDPAGNPLILKVMPGLPLEWTSNEIVLADHRFSAETNTVAMIFPNPLNPNRYVVLNSGYTFPGKDFDDMHWFLHPRLGDYAILNKKRVQSNWPAFSTNTGSWKRNEQFNWDSGSVLHGTGTFRGPYRCAGISYQYRRSLLPGRSEPPSCRRIRLDTV